MKPPTIAALGLALVVASATAGAWLAINAAPAGDWSTLPPGSAERMQALRDASRSGTLDARSAYPPDIDITSAAPPEAAEPQ